ncbi:VOC family protein [Cytophagaceae bacterium YF14B1]|uniref:VOC family protein n=1 Tax=Xanthocytophaga flava TaxID=3048013 RepID=A0AAE3QUH7_9BACT|nr:VOC family protein [Xanthocytophaga flavus]MDJ1483475.1 VOC family protein [Xanthocytophaga flavus]
MNIQLLNHVAVHVADVKTSISFYRDILGLPQLPRPAFDFPGAWFRIGTTQEIHLIGNRTEAVHSHSRGTHFALQVDNIKAVEAELKAKNATFTGPKQRPDGNWQIFIVDPDGHWIELCEIQNTI